MTYEQQAAAKIVNKLIDDDWGVMAREVGEKLKHLHLPTVVLKDWMAEPERRRGIKAAQARRKLRKMASPFGRRAEAFRRIIRTMPVGFKLLGQRDSFSKTHQPEYHATKGWRSYRVPA